MHNQGHNILSQRQDLSIEQCNCCDTIVFIYRNPLLKFTPESFQRFHSALQKIDFEERTVSFGDDTEKLIINTSQQEIQMCFEKPEFELICRALKEASVMLEVNNILYPQP
jgi:hypothetical protein